jgi:hypothetical protein
MNARKSVISFLPFPLEISTVFPLQSVFDPIATIFLGSKPLGTASQRHHEIFLTFGLASKNFSL